MGRSKKSCDANNIQLYPVSTGFVDKGYDFGSGGVHPLKAPKVVLLTGEGVGSNAPVKYGISLNSRLIIPSL